jgi:hypothetical protein
MKRTIATLVTIVCLASSYVWAESPPTAPEKREAPAAEAAPPKKDSGNTTDAATPPKKEETTKSNDAKPAESKADCTDCKKHCGWFWFVALLPTFMFIILLIIVKGALNKSDWSIGNALSESEPLKDRNGDLIKVPMRDKDGNIIKDKNDDIVTNIVLANSASRYIAFIGFFAIIFWLIGLSIPTLFNFACTGKVPDLNNVTSFLIAQAGVFAPYVANKLVSAAKS